MAQNLLFPQITRTAGWGGQLCLQKKKSLWFSLLLSICLLCETDCVNQRCFWVDELSCTVEDEREPLDAASGGTAVWEMGREELGMLAHRSWLPSHKHTLRSQHANILWVMPLYTIYINLCKACVQLRFNMHVPMCEGTSLTMCMAVHESEQWLRFG